MCVCLTLGTRLLCRASDISRWSEPEMHAKQILIERVWSYSNTAAVDLSIFVSLRLFLKGVQRSTVSSFFFQLMFDHGDGKSFKLRHRHSLPPCYNLSLDVQKITLFFLFEGL